MADALPDGALKDHVARLSASARCSSSTSTEGGCAAPSCAMRTARSSCASTWTSPPTAAAAAGGHRAAPARLPERGRSGVAAGPDLLEPAADEPTASAATGPSLVASRVTGAGAARRGADRLPRQHARDNLPGTIADIDTEFLHDLRVAVRRTRSTLKLGRPALPAATCASRWEPRFKWLGDLTTPVATSTSTSWTCPRWRAGWSPPTAADLEPFAAHLARRRRRAPRPGARPAVGPVAAAADDWPTSCRAGRLRASRRHGRRSTAGELAGRASRGRTGGSSAVAPRSPRDSPAEDLHVLRKRCKELRYALEIFAPVLDDAVAQAAVADLKGLQDVLGRFQDTEVQRHGAARVRRGDGGGRTPAPALLAMGELTGHLDGEQARARARVRRPPSPRSYARPAAIARLAAARGAAVKVSPPTTSRAGSGRPRPRSTSPTSPPRRVAHAALGPRPAGRRDVPVPGRAAGQGRQRGAGPGKRPLDDGDQGHRLRQPRPAAGRLPLPQHGSRPRRHEEADPSAAQLLGQRGRRLRRRLPRLPAAASRWCRRTCCTPPTSCWCR